MSEAKNMEQEYVEFDFKDLLPIGISVVVIGVVLAYGLQVTAEVRDDMTTGTYEYNATQATVVAVSKFPAKLGTIVTVILAAVIIGILVKYLGGMGGSR